MKGEISLSNRQFLSYRMFLNCTKYYYALIWDGLMTVLTHCHSTGIRCCPSYSRAQFFTYFFMSPATFYPCKSVTAYPINAFSPIKSNRFKMKVAGSYGQVGFVKMRNVNIFFILC